jgi:gas vesicle protein
MMEMEQMMECLLARMNANAKANQGDLLAKMDSNKKKAEANQDELKAIMNAFREKMDSNQEKAEASMAKLEENMEETIEHQMKHFLLYVD